MLSHHPLFFLPSHKGHSTQDFPETNARVVGGTEVQRNSWPSQVGGSSCPGFYPSQECCVCAPPPETFYFYMYMCVYPQAELTCRLILNFKDVWDQTEVEL